MTLFGKILLYLNLVMSGFMAVYAFVLFVNYQDISDSAPSGGKPGGLIWQRQEQIKVLEPALAPPYKTWKQDVSLLAVWDDIRRANTGWYLAELRHLETGATEADPCRSVVELNNLPKLDKFQRPEMGPATDGAGQPLQAMTHYDKVHTETRESLQDVVIANAEEAFKVVDLTARLKPNSAEEKKLADELNTSLAENIADAEKKGLKKQQERLQVVKDKLEQLLANPPDRKGLRQRLVDEDAKRELIQVEQGLIEPLWKVNDVDTELLLRRRETIEERLKELQGVLLKRYGYKVTRR
jgi:hypothetical protein